MIYSLSKIYRIQSFLENYSRVSQVSFFPYLTLSWLVSPLTPLTSPEIYEAWYNMSILGKSKISITDMKQQVNDFSQSLNGEPELKQKVKVWATEEFYEMLTASCFQNIPVVYRIQ